MDYLTYINSTYPIRRTEQQKEEFREYVTNANDEAFQALIKR